MSAHHGCWGVMPLSYSVPATLAAGQVKGAGVLRWPLLRAPSARSLAMSACVLALVLLLASPVFGAGVADALTGAAVFLACLLFLTVFIRVHRLPADDRDWLVGICSLALAVRVLLATFILNGPVDRYLFGEDQWGYDYIPTVIARTWAGEIPTSVYETSSLVESRRGYFNFVALQYYLLGPALVVPRIVNALAGALVVFYSVGLTARVFGRLEARVAGMWTALFPSLIIWSAVNLRDIWLTLSVLVIVHHAFLLRDRFSALSVSVIVGHLIWVHYSRAYLVFIMVVACVSIFVFARSTNRFRDIVVAILLAILLLALYQGMGLGREGIEWLDLDRIAEQRERLARANVGHSGYLQDVDVRDPAVLVVSFPLLLAYFLFSPFPWQMGVARRAVLAPEMLFWYWLTPFVFFSIRHVVREKTKRQLALLMTLAVVTVAFAIPSSNMGLAYRYRSQIIPLFLAFAAAGFVRRRAPAFAGDSADHGVSAPSR